jgi:hypothetical protein
LCGGACTTVFCVRCFRKTHTPIPWINYSANTIYTYPYINVWKKIFFLSKTGKKKKGEGVLYKGGSNDGDCYMARFTCHMEGNKPPKGLKSKTKTQSARTKGALHWKNTLVDQCYKKRRKRRRITSKHIHMSLKYKSDCSEVY